MMRLYVDFDKLYEEADVNFYGQEYDNIFEELKVMKYDTVFKDEFKYLTESYTSEKYPVLENIIKDMSKTFKNFMQKFRSRIKISQNKLLKDYNEKHMIRMETFKFINTLDDFDNYMITDIKKHKYANVINNKYRKQVLDNLLLLGKKYCIHCAYIPEKTMFSKVKAEFTNPERIARYSEVIDFINEHETVLIKKDWDIFIDVQEIKDIFITLDSIVIDIETLVHTMDINNPEETFNEFNTIKYPEWHRKITQMFNTGDIESIDVYNTFMEISKKKIPEIWTKVTPDIMNKIMLFDKESESDVHLINNLSSKFNGMSKQLTPPKQYTYKMLETEYDKIFKFYCSVVNLLIDVVIVRMDNVRNIIELLHKLIDELPMYYTPVKYDKSQISINWNDEIL